MDYPLEPDELLSESDELLETPVGFFKMQMSCLKNQISFSKNLMSCLKN